MICAGVAVIAADTLVTFTDQAPGTDVLRLRQTEKTTSSRNNSPIPGSSNPVDHGQLIKSSK